MKTILVGIPTLNEARNVENMVARLGRLPLSLDVLFVDDNSSDGTGKILDSIAKRNPAVKVLHRPVTTGIGSAHQAILGYAYSHEYEALITMDCDFSHQPEDLPRLLEALKEKPLVVGSRFLDTRSLNEWSFERKILTHLGHWLTTCLIDLPMDATGAFRAYDLRNIQKGIWENVESAGYAFFFESLWVLKKNGFTCKEISIHLPKRVYGESKMNLLQALRSLFLLIRLWLKKEILNKSKNNAEDWDHYWKANRSKNRQWYALMASLYRRLFIVKRLNKLLERHFAKGARLYHLGCGSGEVDEIAAQNFEIIGADISQEARNQYKKNYPKNEVRSVNILNEFLEPPLDGIYCLGLLEHFSKKDIVQIIKNMKSSIADKGRIVIFWPYKYAPSVLFLRLISSLRKLVKIKEPLHPPEPSLVRNRAEAENMIQKAGCRILDYDFSINDLGIQAAIIIEKNNNSIKNG